MSLEKTNGNSNQNQAKSVSKPGANQLHPENPQRSKFMQSLRYFLSIATSNRELKIKYLPNGRGFIVHHNSQTGQKLNQLILDIFGREIDLFNQLMVRFGFNISHKLERGSREQRLIYKCNQQCLKSQNDQENSHLFESQSAQMNENEQENDDFPREEEIENIIKNKQSKNGFVKPNIILNRVHSDGALGMKQSRRVEDISLEVKLHEGDIFSTPSNAHRKINIKKQVNFENQIERPNQSLSLVDRNLVYKENYERCSKLIDNTIFDLLSAHKANKIENRVDELLGKVTEIYDILSDNIENVNSIVQYLSKNQENSAKKQSDVMSPGFRPLNNEG